MSIERKRGRAVTRRAALGGAAAGPLALLAACGAAQEAPVQPLGPLPAKITFFVQTNANDNTRYWQQFGAWFKEANPSTTVESVLPPTDTAYQVKLLTLFAAGTVPDLFHLNNRYVRDYHGRGLIQPLDPLLRRVAFPTADVIPGVLVPYRIDGQLYGIPRDNSTGVLYYNKDLFAAAGVKEPTADWTWDELLAAAKQLSAPDRGKFGTSFPQVGSISEVNHLAVLKAFGGAWFDDALKQVKIDSPESRRALQFMADLRLRERVAPRPDEVQPGDLFLTQQVAIHHAGQAYVQNAKRGNPIFQWDAAPIPRGPSGRHNVVGSTGYCIPKQAPNAAAGAALLKFLSEERVQREMMVEGRWTTPRKAFLQYAAPADGKPSRYKEAIQDRLLASQGVAMPAGMDEMDTFYEKETAPVWLGQRTLTEALTVVGTEWRRLLQASGRPG